MMQVKYHVEAWGRENQVHLENNEKASVKTLDFSYFLNSKAEFAKAKDPTDYNLHKGRYCLFCSH